MMRALATRHEEARRASRSRRAAELRHANDSDILFSRLLDFAVQGCQSPETLTSYEIKQISFAFLTYLALDERDGRIP